MIWLLICLEIKNVVSELFIRGRKHNIRPRFISRSYFAVQKHIWLNSTPYFIMKIPNKQELRQMACNHSTDIGYEELMNFTKNVLQNHIPF